MVGNPKLAVITQRSFRGAAEAALLSALALLNGTVALAGEYRLIEGMGLPVCEAYRRNFEPRHDSEPMACQRSYDPSIAGFASVPWKKLDLNEHFNLYQEAERYLATDVVSAQQSTVLSEDEARKISERLHGKAEHLLGPQVWMTTLSEMASAHATIESRGSSISSFC